MNGTTKAATKLVRWHFAIATIFESIKYFHQLGLYFVLPGSSYGLVGSTFAVAYLSANLAGCERGNALIPFARRIASHPQRWRYLKTDLVIPLLTSHSIGAFFVFYTIYAVTQHTALAIAGACISLGEGLRIGVRPLIYALSQDYHAAQHESAISYIYILCVWTTWLFFKPYCTGTFITMLYAATSLIGCIYLFLAGHRLLMRCQIIPTDQSLPTARKTIPTQIWLMITHLPHHLFSANFLVPFFAYHGGLTLASTLKITSEIAGAIKTILKSSIGFPLNAVLNSQPEASADQCSALMKNIQHTTFNLAKILIFAAVIGVGGVLIPLSFYTKIIFLGFCLLIITDYLCMPYELLSIHSGTLRRVAGVRLAEIIIDGCLMMFLPQWPLVIVGAISSMRFITWLLLRAYA